MINEYASKNEVCHTMRIRANTQTVESLVRGLLMAFSTAISGNLCTFAASFEGRLARPNGSRKSSARARPPRWSAARRRWRGRNIPRSGRNCRRTDRDFLPAGPFFVHRRGKMMRINWRR